MLLVERGATLRFAAAACNVALSTVHRWVVRWRAAPIADRSSLACLADRSSRPHHSPRLLCDDTQQRVLELRARTGWGPRLLAGELSIAHQIVDERVGVVVAVDDGTRVGIRPDVPVK